MFICEKVTPTITAIGIWDEEWQSYNNCYVIQEESKLIMIDSCKAIHTPILEDALQSIELVPDQFTHYLATHGHEDHVQGVVLFPNATAYIHEFDFDSMEYENPSRFTTDWESLHLEANIHMTPVGFHSPGHVMYLHRDTATLFDGDVICFFGDPLSNEGFVSFGADLRQAWVDYIENGGIRPEDKEAYIRVIEMLSMQEATALCTGHGGVLKEDISSFCAQLISSFNK